MAGETVRVGDLIRSRRTLKIVPVGTVLRERNAAGVWTKEGDNAWRHRNGGMYRDHDFSMNYNVIESFPDGMVEFTRPLMTLEQVKWEYRTGALAAASAHGVSIGAVETSLSRMGAGASDVQSLLGHGVQIDPQTRRNLPEGTVIFSGDPKVPDFLSVNVLKGGRWVRVLGEANLDDTAPQTIESINGDSTSPEWLTKVGTEEDQQAIAEFKATAWRVGWELKQQMGWCGTYEDISRGLGVSEDAPALARNGGYVPGTRIRFDNANTLPEGSLLFWQHRTDHTQWALFQRTNDAANQAGTRRLLAGSAVQDNEQQKRYMTVASLILEDGTTNWEVPAGLIREVWGMLPPGTVFSYNGEMNSRFVMCRDHRGYTGETVRDVGAHDLDAYGGEGARIMVRRWPT